LTGIERLIAVAFVTAFAGCTDRKGRQSTTAAGFKAFSPPGAALLAAPATEIAAQRVGDEVLIAWSQAEDKCEQVMLARFRPKTSTWERPEKAPIEQCGEVTNIGLYADRDNELLLAGIRTPSASYGLVFRRSKPADPWVLIKRFFGARAELPSTKIITHPKHGIFFAWESKAYSIECKSVLYRFKTDSAEQPEKIEPPRGPIDRAPCGAVVALAGEQVAVVWQELLEDRKELRIRAGIWPELEAAKAMASEVPERFADLLFDAAPLPGGCLGVSWIRLHVSDDSRSTMFAEWCPNREPVQITMGTHPAKEGSFGPAAISCAEDGSSCLVSYVKQSSSSSIHTCFVERSKSSGFEARCSSSAPAELASSALPVFGDQGWYLLGLVRDDKDESAVRPTLVQVGSGQR
jgi:hypothetical protein